MKKFRNFRINDLEMALAPDGRPPRVGMSACPASPRRRGNALDPRYRGCATFRHKPGGRTLLPRKACLRRAAKMRQHALRGRAEPPCPEAPAPKGAAVLPVQGRPPRGLWFISPPACTAHPCWRGEGGLLTAISWLAAPAAGWLASDFAVLLILREISKIQRNPQRRHA